MFFQLEKRELIDREAGRVTVVDTGTDHINISIRELGTCNLSIGRAIEPKKGMAIVNAGIRKERSMEQRRTPALGFIELLYKYLGIPREHVYVTLTEHKGEDFHLAETCTNVHGFRTHRLSIKRC